MIAAQGILTSRGGKTSHAAVVARGMGKTCVCGAEELEVDVEARRLTTPDGTVVAEGDVLSLDGTTGVVYAGAVPVRPSPVVEYFEGQLAPEDADELVQAVHRVMGTADDVRELARRLSRGAGVSTARHSFPRRGLGRRRLVVRVLAARAESRAK